MSRRKLRFSNQLSQVAVLMLEDVRMPDRQRLIAGNVAFLDREDAEVLVMQDQAEPYETCSILKVCHLPDSGMMIEPSSALRGLPPDLAARLEAAGRIRILRSDTEVEVHRDAWRAHNERGRDLIARSRARMREAQAARSTELNQQAVEFAHVVEKHAATAPSIEWGAR